MKCKIVNCDSERLTEEQSEEKYGSKDYAGYCDLHARERFVLDTRYLREDEEEKKREEEEENE